MNGAGAFTTLQQRHGTKGQACLSKVRCCRRQEGINDLAHRGRLLCGLEQDIGEVSWWGPQS